MNAASCLVMACFWIVWHRKHVEGGHSVNRKGLVLHAMDKLCQYVSWLSQ